VPWTITEATHTFGDPPPPVLNTTPDTYAPIACRWVRGLATIFRMPVAPFSASCLRSELRGHLAGRGEGRADVVSALDPSRFLLLG